MQNKVIAVVTGGTTGIGKAAVDAFEKRGITTYILGIGEQPSDSELRKYISCDVSKNKDVVAAFQLIEEQAGHLNYLVNNAGVLSYGTVTDIDEEEWDRVMGVNLKGNFLCAKNAIPLMPEESVIINVASVQSYVTQPLVAAYCTSKAAVLGLTRSIATDFGPKIRCVAVCPGTIDTPMLQGALAQASDPEAMMAELNATHLTGRIGKPEEVGELISFLCSDKCAFITGQAIRVDGGLGVNIGGSKN
tara:strand:- start:18825 stop:19565 length:741 start_codon:yes stop_codon:yes gene_type:complete